MGDDRAQQISPERGRTHGAFYDNAMIAIQSRAINRAHPGWNKLTNAQQLALDEIELKKARILSGAAGFKEHWDDIAGYANLGGRDAT